MINHLEDTCLLACRCPEKLMIGQLVSNFEKGNMLTTDQFKNFLFGFYVKYRNVKHIGTKSEASSPNKFCKWCPSIGGRALIRRVVIPDIDVIGKVHCKIIFQRLASSITRLKNYLQVQLRLAGGNNPCSECKVSMLNPVLQQNFEIILEAFCPCA